MEGNWLGYSISQMSIAQLNAIVAMLQEVTGKKKKKRTMNNRFVAMAQYKSEKEEEVLRFTIFQMLLNGFEIQMDSHTTVEQYTAKIYEKLTMHPDVYVAQSWRRFLIMDEYRTYRLNDDLVQLLKEVDVNINLQDESLFTNLQQWSKGTFVLSDTHQKMGHILEAQMPEILNTNIQPFLWLINPPSYEQVITQIYMAYMRNPLRTDMIPLQVSYNRFLEKCHLLEKKLAQVEQQMEEICTLEQQLQQQALSQQKAREKEEDIIRHCKQIVRAKVIETGVLPFVETHTATIDHLRYDIAQLEKMLIPATGSLWGTIKSSIKNQEIKLKKRKKENALQIAYEKIVQAIISQNISFAEDEQKEIARRLQALKKIRLLEDNMLIEGTRLKQKRQFIEHENQHLLKELQRLKNEMIQQ